MKRTTITILMMLAPAMLQAAEPMVLKPGEPPPKKFISLKSARDESAQSIKATAENKSYQLRTDKSRMESGFMRIDRARAVPISPQHALITPVTTPSVARDIKLIVPDAETIEPESEEIVGNTEGADPVLSLFDSGEGELTSFRDALSGRNVVSLAGGVRHPRWPIPLNVHQALSSGYGMRADPFNGRPTFHGGIDISAPSGTPVLATADGEVLQVETDANYGKYVTLQHADGTLSRYGHLSAQSVRQGQHVPAGQTIGAVGSTGRSTGAHLDYRVSKNGIKFDPLSILTIPSGVDMGSVKAPVAVANGAKPMNALPKRPMVIKVR